MKTPDGLSEEDAQLLLSEEEGVLSNEIFDRIKDVLGYKINTFPKPKEIDLIVFNQSDPDLIFDIGENYRKKNPPTPKEIDDTIKFFQEETRRQRRESESA